MSTSSRCPQGAEVLSPFHPQVRLVRKIGNGIYPGYPKVQPRLLYKVMWLQDAYDIEDAFSWRWWDCDWNSTHPVELQWRLLAFSLCCSQAFQVSGKVDFRNWLFFTCIVAAEDPSPIPVIRSPVIRSCFTRKAKNIRLPCLHICGQSFIALPNTRNPATVYGSSGWEAQQELYWHIGIPREHVFL